jgi:hypothetical protein
MPPSSRGGSIMAAFSGPKSAASFRPKEKYLIFLVLATFGFVCFGAIFFLPASNSLSNMPNNGSGEKNMNRVYRVYKELQEAGRDLMLPAPPVDHEADRLGQHDLNFHGPHGVINKPDPHKVEDKAKLLAQIELDAQIDELRRKKLEEQPHRVLAKPEQIHADKNQAVDHQDAKKSSSEGVNKAPVPVQVPKAQGVQHKHGVGDRVVITGGEDTNDVSAQDRREHVKSVSKTYILKICFSRVVTSFFKLQD